MHAWESIQKVLEHIEDNLTASHSPEELSKLAALSPFYFQRLFRRLVKHPVSEYIKFRRLARACETLAKNKTRAMPCTFQLHKNSRILDIALDSGFNSHEHFTKTFKAAFGITPEEYRENPVHLSQIMKPNLLLNYVMVDEGVPLITEDIVIEINRRKLDIPERYIGVSAKVPVEQGTFGDTTAVSGPGKAWDDFRRQKSGLSCISHDAAELGASMLSGEDNGLFIYFAGAQTLPGAAVPNGLTSWELPAGEYIVCQFEAENFEELREVSINKALKYLFETWLPGHNIACTEPFSAEKYSAVQSSPASMEIWVLPKTL